MKLDELKGAPGAWKREKRIGRGIGSGHGKTSTKGHKGQAARSGGTKGPGFEGGQQPITRRIPKRGFHSPFKKRYRVVTVASLEARFDPESEVTLAALVDRGLAKKMDLVVILGDGAISKPMTVAAHRFSASARQKIESAGGKVAVVVSGRFA